MKTKTCNKCKIEKDINKMTKKSTGYKWIYTCFDCQEVRKQTIKLKRETIKDKRRQKLLNKEKVKKQKYFIKFKAKRKKRREYRIRKEIRIGKRNYHKNRYPDMYEIELKKYKIFQMVDNIRSRLSHALKRNSKFASTEELIGCSFLDLKKHLESKFKSGMSWDNYGKWEVDHIKPCASFDLSKSEEQRKCFHYKNLQPLWAIENRKKHTKHRK